MHKLPRRPTVQQSPFGRASASGSSMAAALAEGQADEAEDEPEYPLPGSRSQCDGCRAIIFDYMHCLTCGEEDGFDLCNECHAEVSQLSGVVYKKHARHQHSHRMMRVAHGCEPVTGYAAAAQFHDGLSENAPPQRVQQQQQQHECRGHHHDAASANGSIERGNRLGSRPCVRQSDIYRQRESGDAMKSMLGQDHLKW